MTYQQDQRFFTRLAIGLSILIVVAFAQFALLGRVDIANAHLRAHFHGVVMLAWLGLFIAQNVLAERGSIETHRKLGKVGAVLALLVAGTASYLGIVNVAGGTQPPFYGSAYFLTLTHISAVLFLGLVGWALMRKGDTQWHRRLMFGSLIVILEPAFGRLLPTPLLMPYALWIIMIFQLGFSLLIAMHDRKALGAIHPATIAGAIAVILQHVILETVSRWGPMIELAEGLRATG